MIGCSLLGEAEYENLRARLEPGQHTLLIAANGLYSFKGCGGIFDRIQLAQGATAASGSAIATTSTSAGSR